MIDEVLTANGHPNVRGTHRNTLEFTKETQLSPRGDCIVAVAADKGMADLSEGFKRKLKTENCRLEITIECGGIKETVTAYGHPGLILEHPTDMVVRKTEFICPRTLAIRADKAAKDLSRGLVEELKNGLPVAVRLRVM
ncbi:MAG: DUF371 domain-containing protein [Candidatus Altiarchaeota archaeon]